MKILCTDLEGTLAPEIWQELGEHLNIPELNLTTRDIPNFEDFAAIKLVVEASGAVKNLTMLEAIDFSKATAKAGKIGYKAPGQ